MTFAPRTTSTRVHDRRSPELAVRRDVAWSNADGAPGASDQQLVELSPAQDGSAASGRLRALLVALDVVGATVAWTTAVVLLHPSETAGEDGLGARVGVAAALVALTIALVARERLYRSRVCQVRAHEIAGLVRVGAACAVTALVVGEGFGVTLHPGTAAAGAAGMVVVLAGLRSAYCGWLRRCRARGRCTRGLVVLGTNHDALELSRLFEDQPELGYRVIGVLGSEEEWRAHATATPWLGPTDSAARMLRCSGAGAVVVASALSSAALDRVVHALVDQHTHVLVSTGIRHIGSGRLRAVPLGHEPFFYVEEHSPTRLQAAAKRAFDLAFASVLLALSLPVLACAAAAIALDDGGPVLFRQERVGLAGRRFDMLKLRTMVPNAAEHLHEVAGRNERRDGPLFKLADDPRVTRTGRFLRITSIDELPQLVNVLRGEMSLVGPRPALPTEVAAFDSELLARTKVRPGITGLWQIEARDNPSFRVYRRLDLYYVENWSMALDLAILWATAMSTLSRVVATIGRLLSRALPRRPEPRSVPGAATQTPAVSVPDGTGP